MSNPYDNEPPYGAPEPGEPSYEPYAANPYDAGGPSPYATKTPVDGVSIAAFVSSLTCCAAPLAVILGFVGLSRTKGDQRGGRWAAITGLALGILGTLALLGFGGLVTWFALNTTDPDRAEVGDCVDVDREGEADATLWSKECTEPHDAEIVVVDGLTGDEAADLDEGGDPTALCEARLLTSKYAGLDRDSYYLRIVVESLSDRTAGDNFLCYLEPTEGQLEEPLLD